MLATSSKYSPEEVAARVIPSLAPLAIDQVAEVCVSGYPSFSWSSLSVLHGAFGLTSSGPMIV